MSVIGNIYFLPCRSGSVYVNIANECLNNCLFCIRRKGWEFYGSNLALDRGLPSSDTIKRSLAQLPGWESAREVVFCGMGEPLLRHECLLDVCAWIRDSPNPPAIRIDTSGLFAMTAELLAALEIADVISVSLNAENAEKYENLCKPTIEDAYGILTRFLHALKADELEAKRKGRRFPEVRLSVVDTSEEEYLPPSGRNGYSPGTFPVPDFEACRKIAEEQFGWKFVIKRLFRDSCDTRWDDPEVQDKLARGIPIDTCKDCAFRH